MENYGGLVSMVDTRKLERELASCVIPKSFLERYWETRLQSKEAKESGSMTVSDISK